MKFSLDSLQKLFIQTLEWAQQHVFTVEMLLQVLTVGILYVASNYLAKPIKAYVDTHPATNYGERKAKESLKELAVPTVLCLLLWVATAGSGEMQWQNRFLHITASLITAWVVISFTAGFVRGKLIAKLITIIVWIVAALSILELLTPTIDFLDKLAFKVGELRISMLAIVKAAFLLIVMLWLAAVLSKAVEKRLYLSGQLEPSLQVLLSKLVKISLVVIAVFMGFGAVGIDMSAFAVFGGAIGLGIGFGLQKVVSNLICGVILLIDRSIKPGDVIALPNENTFGRVNRLEARCVSVLTRDGQEHLIPNEDFITQKVENWSFTDRNVRLKIPVGVSYKSDPRKVMDMLVKAAKGEKRVLETPEPVARLVEFADSSMNFELRVWIKDPEEGVINIRSAILLKIWDEFKKNKIEIPYPQRDIHIKTGRLKKA